MAETDELVEKREPGPKARDNVVSTGLPADLYRDFEEYRADNDITSTSDAARRLIKKGLETDHSPIPTVMMAVVGLLIGIPIQPNAPSELFIALAVGLLIATAGFERGYFDR